MAAYGGIYEWYWGTFLNEYSGPDHNNMWVVSIVPQEGEQKFLNALKMEAARFDVDGNAVDDQGIVDGWESTLMANMVDATWNANTAELPETLNITNWGSRNVLIGVNNVMIPNDALNTKNADMGPGYTWVPPLMADMHQPFQPLQLSFYYTAYPFSEFIVRPWTMAVNRYGLKLRCLRAHIICTLFTRRNNVYANSNNWAPKFQYLFYSCFPQGTPNITLDYNDDAQDKTSQISFGYDFYRMRTPVSTYSDLRHASDDFTHKEAFADYIANKTRKEVEQKVNGIEELPDTWKRPEDDGTINGEPGMVFGKGMGGEQVGPDIKSVDADEPKKVSIPIGPIEPWNLDEPLYKVPIGGIGGLLASVVRKVFDATVGSRVLGALDTPMFFLFRPKYKRVGPDEPDGVGGAHKGVREPDTADSAVSTRFGVLPDEPDTLGGTWVDEQIPDEPEYIGSSENGVGLDEVVDLPTTFVDEIIPDEPVGFWSGNGSVGNDEPNELGGSLMPVGDDEPSIGNRNSRRVGDDEPDEMGIKDAQTDGDDELKRLKSAEVPVSGGGPNPKSTVLEVPRRDEPRRRLGFIFTPEKDEPEKLNVPSNPVPDGFVDGIGGVSKDVTEESPEMPVADKSVGPDEPADVPGVAMRVG